MLLMLKYSVDFHCNNVVIVIIIICIAFMQGIYNDMPETNHVSSIYNVAAIPWLQYIVYVMLCLMKMFYTYHHHHRHGCRHCCCLKVKQSLSVP